MRKQLSVLLILLAFVFSVSAQRLSETERNLRKHVAYLASPELEGRKTGEQGAIYAAGYIANMFARYKLKAGVAESVNGKTTRGFLQLFPYISVVKLGRDNFLRLIPEDASKEPKMEPGANWMPIGTSTNGYAAPTHLVFAGYGIASSAVKRDDYAGLDAKDKIVLILNGAPDAGNPHSELARFDLHAKAKIAQEKGAKAILVVGESVDFKNEKLAKLAYDQTLGETAIPAAVVSREIAAQLFGGKTRLDEALQAAKTSNLAAFEFPKIIAQVKVDLTKTQAGETHNVIGILEGRDPQLKTEAVVIGAHYDHLGRGGAGSLAANSTEIHHGADDNASGVAAMLELARQFSEERNNKRTIIFIAFGGEEEGLVGSKHYVNNPVFPIEKTVAMINLDMVGRLKDNKLTIGGVGTASEWKNWVEYRNFNLGSETTLVPADLPSPKIPMEAQAKTTSVTMANVPAKTGLFQLQLNEDGFGPSDHSSFYGKKVPVLFFFTGTHADYHKPSDTAEKINYDGLQKITEFVGEIVKALVQNPSKPTYKVAASSGTGGRMTFNVSLGTIPSYGGAGDGLILDGVRDNSPAAKAGLKAGDKIVRLAGRDVRNVSDYTFVLSEMKAGTQYEVVVLRGKETLTLKITPAGRN